MDHPMIREIEFYGGPKEHGQEPEREFVMEDWFGNEIREGDEYFEVKGRVYAVELIDDDVFDLLDLIKAPRKTA